MSQKAPAFNWIFVYQATTIICGLGAILWLLAMLFGQWHELSALHSFLGLTFPLYIFLLCAIVLDSFLGLFPIRFRDATIVLNFAVPLTVLLLLASVVSEVGGATAVYSATAIVTFGAPLGELLRQLQQKKQTLSLTQLTGRMGLYTASNAVASLLSAIAFLAVVAYLSASFSEASFIQPPLIATTAYAIVFFIASKLLLWPHDWAIDQFLLPDEQGLPRVDLATLVAIIPIPFFIVVLIGNLFRSGGTTAEIVQIVFLLGLFAAFILVARSYAQVEITGAAQQERGLLDQALRGSVNMVELSKRLGQLLQQDRYPYRWGAFYTQQQGLPSHNGTYHLRAHMDKQGNTIPFAKEFIEAGYEPPITKEGELPDEEVVHWPRWVVNKKEGGFLARTVHTGQLQIIMGRGQLPQQSSEPFLPREIRLLCVPITDQDITIGLLTLAQPKEQFNGVARKEIAVLAKVIGSSLQQIFRIENRLDAIYRDTERYATNPEKFQIAIEQLMNQGVDVPFLLDRITQTAFRNDLVAVMQDVAQAGTGKHSESPHIRLSESDLAEIYAFVRHMKKQETPSLETHRAIMAHLQTIASSLTLAFSFRYQWPDLQRGNEFQPLYHFFTEAMKAHTVAAFTSLSAELQKTIDKLDKEGGAQFAVPYLQQIQSILEQLKQQQYAQAEAKIKDVQSQVAEKVVDPEKFIFLTLLRTWQTIIETTKAEIGGIQAQANAALQLSLRHHYALKLEAVSVGAQLQNTGEGTAHFVLIRLLPDESYKIIGPAEQQLGTVPPAQIKQATFTIHVLEAQEAKLRFDVEYRDPERQALSVPGTLSLSLQEVPVAFCPILSPYALGRPLSVNSPLFFGRNAIFQFLNEHLNTQLPQQPVLLLYGERRIGKTSVLKQLPQRLQDSNYVHIFFDCQVVEKPDSLLSFLQSLAREIVYSLQEIGIDMKPPIDAYLSQEPALVFGREYLPLVLQQLGPRYLLIAFDEYERIDPAVDDALRSLVQGEPRLALIFSGTHKLQARFKKSQSSLFHSGVDKEITFLEAAEACQLIKEPVKERLTYDGLAIAQIIDLTNGHPLLTQRLCYYLVNCSNRKKRNYVTLEDVTEATQEMTEGDISFLSYLWQDASPQEQAVLASLAQALKTQSHASAQTIAQQLPYTALPLAPGIIHQAFESLQTRSRILMRENNPDGSHTYRFTAELYQLWLAKHHPLN